MGLFQLGVDMAMMPMGEGMGVGITKSKKLWLVAVLCFAIGAVVTIAEPDLTVLANQVPSIPNPVLILTVAVGVGYFWWWRCCASFSRSSCCTCCGFRIFWCS